MEWRAAKQSDVALGLTLPDGSLQTVAIDSWTTCEEAANMSLAVLGLQAQGWTVVLDDNDTITDTCGLDYILDLVGEKELCPAFPSPKNDLLRTKKRSFQQPMRPSKGNQSTIDAEPSSPKRPLIPPPAPPQSVKVKNEKSNFEEERVEYVRSNAPPMHRKTSIDLLSRSSALNERYFEVEKSRSRSLDDLLNSDGEPTASTMVREIEQPVNELGLSGSRLNDRYHSAERLTPLKQPIPSTRLLKVPYVGKRAPSTHSSKYMDRSDLLVRSSGMSDTSETPSLASHVRRVRVPSQASDVDQFLDDLFSPVLDGNLDDLSDARSLAASIRGATFVSYSEAPFLNEDVTILQNVDLLCQNIKGGGDEENETLVNAFVEEYITELFQPIFLNENIRHLAEKRELADSIRGGGNGGINVGGDSSHQQVQRAFLESAMEQNIKIQQQLIAQNEALQTLLGQQNENAAASPSQIHTPTALSQLRPDVAAHNENESSFSYPPPPVSIRSTIPWRR